MPFRSLVLHDDPDVLDTLVQALRRRAHRVVATGDPHGVLPSHLDAPFALVVTGWGVGGWAGVPLVRALRDVPAGRTRPVVLVLRAADAVDGAEEAMLDAGVGDVVSWPTSEGLLARRLLVAERQVLEADRRRAAEDALRRSAAAMRVVLDRLPDGIAVHRDTRFEYVNAALAAMLGWDAPRELHGRSLLELVEDREGLAAGLAADAARGGPHEATLVRRDGGTVVAELAHLAVDFDGVASTLTLARDLRERRRLEATLRQADRMASVGTLALGVAHELNNPLAFVMSNLEVLREELTRCRGRLEAEPLEALEALARDALEGADRMRQVVRDLKTFSRDPDGPAQPVSVEGVLRASLHLTRNEIVHRARLEEEVLAPLPAVLGNEARLGQVFLNLLVNAAQALPDRAPAENRIRVAAFTDADGHAVVEVSDNGVGIEPRDLSHVFDPFYTTKPPTLGTGLGLSIVHNVVQGMGGEVTLESTPGRGATFRVRLPPAARRHPRGRRTSSGAIAAAPASGPRARVLVIDDDALVARSIVRVLAGHDVTVAAGGAEALGLLARAPGAYDLVLCDLMMPELSGIEVFERACEARPELAARFVFMTGGAFTPRARVFLERVPNEALEKPFDPRELRALVERRAAGAPPHALDGS